MDERVERLVAEILHLPAAEVTDDLVMRSTDAWDSLRHMELVARLEDAFGLQFTFDEIVAMRSVHEIKAVLQNRIARH